MIGAIVGDIVGSRFEFSNHKSKDFDFFDFEKCSYTDDSILTVAISTVFSRWGSSPKNAIATVFSRLGISPKKKQLESLKYNKDTGEMVVSALRSFSRFYPYPVGGYGVMFTNWMLTPASEQRPYGSFGNGAAMRVSPVAYVAKSLDDVKDWSQIVTQVTHNHFEGIKGAEATAVATYLALHGKSKQRIKEYIEAEYYKLDFTLDEIRPTYSFDGSCQGTVPQALQCFFESTDFEDAIRNAISIGGDSDTIGAITGAVAGAFYGVPNDIRSLAEMFLDERLLDELHKFERMFPNPHE